MFVLITVVFVAFACIAICSATYPKKQIPLENAAIEKWRKSLVTLWRGSKNIYFAYQKRDCEAEKRTMNLSKVCRDAYGRIFLHGLCNTRNAERHFCIDRIDGDIVCAETGEVFEKNAFLNIACNICNMNSKTNNSRPNIVTQGMKEQQEFIYTLGNASKKDKNFTLTNLFSLYDTNTILQSAAKENEGAYLARIFENTLANSFLSNDREEYKKCLMALESSHKLAKMVRSVNYIHMTRDALEMEPEFLFTKKPSDNVVFLENLVEHFSQSDRRIVRLSALKYFLRISKAYAKNSWCDKDIQETSYLYTGKDGGDEPTFEQHIKPFLEIVVGEPLPDTLLYKKFKNHFRIFYQEECVLMKVRFGNYALTGFTFPDKTTMNRDEVHPYGRVEKHVTQKVRAALLLE